MPRWLRQLRARLRYRRFDDDLREEIDVHRAMAEEERRVEGASPIEIQMGTARQLGNVLLAREASREVWIPPWLASVRQDVRFAARGFVRTPAFTLTALGALVIGLGLNLSLFAVANGMLMRPWPVPFPERVVRLFVQHHTAQADAASGPVTLGEFEFLRQHATTIDLAAFSLVGGYRIDDDALPVMSRNVSDGYFESLAIPLVLGRGFRPDENQIGHPVPVAVIGYRVWSERYAGTLDVVGRQIRVNDVLFTIVGVAAKGATDTPVGGGLPSIWVPYAAQPLMFATTDDERRKALESQRLNFDNLSIEAAGRLRPGATRATAQDELTALDRQYRAGRRPDTVAGILATGTEEAAVPRNREAGMMRVLALVLTGLVLLLLLTCANVGNLYLARGAARRAEIAIRLGLGAGRARVVRQLLTETFVLSLTAGVVALGVAAVLPRAILRRYIPSDALASWRLLPDWRVAGLALAFVMLTTVVSGLLPALRSTHRLGLRQHPRDGGRSGLRSTLLAAQVAIATLLLVATALLERGIRHAANIDLGFDMRGVTAVSLSLPPRTYDPAAFKTLITTLDRRVRDLGIGRIGAASPIPLSGGFVGMSARRADLGDDSLVWIHHDTVNRDYFDLLGIPLVAGGWFSDDVTAADVVINETLAGALWRGESAVGRTFIMNRTNTVRVAGVVRDAHTDSLERIEPTVFTYGTGTNFLIQSNTAAVDRLRTLLAALAPRGVIKIRPLTANIEDQLDETKVGAAVAGAIGILALLLAAVGVFGTFSLIVIERTREIGVRMAIGAGPSDVLGLVARRSGTALGGGLITGVFLSLVAGPALRNYLYGLGPRDPIAYLWVVTVLTVAGAAATSLPAWRALHLDPAITLRHE